MSMRREKHGMHVVIIRGASGFIVNAQSDLDTLPETHGATTIEQALAVARGILLAGEAPADANILSPTDARFWRHNNSSHKQDSQS
jgi:hypothetical protein